MLRPFWTYVQSFSTPENYFFRVARYMLVLKYNYFLTQDPSQEH